MARTHFARRARLCCTRSKKLFCFMRSPRLNSETSESGFVTAFHHINGKTAVLHLLRMLLAESDNSYVLDKLKVRCTTLSRSASFSLHACKHSAAQQYSPYYSANYASHTRRQACASLDKGVVLAFAAGAIIC